MVELRKDEAGAIVKALRRSTMTNQPAVLSPAQAKFLLVSTDLIAKVPKPGLVRGAFSRALPKDGSK